MKQLPSEEAQSSSLAPGAIPHTARPPTFARQIVRALIIVPGATLLGVGYFALSIGIIGRHGLVLGAAFIAATALIVLWARSFIVVVCTEVHERRTDRSSTVVTSW
jgi:hypothetical protein